MTECHTCGDSISLTEKQRRTPKSPKFCSRSCQAKYVLKISGNRIRLKSLEATTGIQITDAAYGKTAQNVLGKFYCVKSPDGIIYTFRNLNQFVRDNAALFPTGYAQEPRSRSAKSEDSIATGSSIAAHGLGRLFTESKHTRQLLSWHGWQGVWKKDRLGNVTWERARDAS